MVCSSTYKTPRDGDDRVTHPPRPSLPCNTTVSIVEHDSAGRATRLYVPCNTTAHIGHYHRARRATRLCVSCNKDQHVVLRTVPGSAFWNPCAKLHVLATHIHPPSIPQNTESSQAQSPSLCLRNNQTALESIFMTWSLAVDPLMAILSKVRSTCPSDRHIRDPYFRTILT